MPSREQEIIDMKNSRLFTAALFAGAISLIQSAAVHAQGWSDLTATFVLDGAIPKPKALVINKDPAVCGKHNLVDESLVVNPANKGIANVVVYLYVAPRTGKKPPIHESYKATEKDSVLLDNHNCRFEPHIAIVRTTQTLVAGNKDPVGHNTNMALSKNPPQNPLIPGGGTVKFNLTVEETLPAPVSCGIHPWMKGYLVVKEHPYMAVSDKDGKVTIKNVPAGKWTFQFWQEASGYLSDAKQNGKPVKWERGRVELDIKAGAPTDLGEIKVSPTIFKLN
jgi:hypothetical protein